MTSNVWHHLVGPDYDSSPNSLVPPFSRFFVPTPLFDQLWTDYQLRWDEADYGGISVLRLPPDKVGTAASPALVV